jgi:hypothetical protein
MRLPFLTTASTSSCQFGVMFFPDKRVSFGRPRVVARRFPVRGLGRLELKCRMRLCHRRGRGRRDVGL